RALKRFNAQFQSRKIGKYYLAVVESDMEVGQPCHWEDFVRKIPDAARAEIVPEGHEGARHARLEATVLATAEGLSLLGIDLATGRMHQIRVQAATRGCPIVGDWVYGARRRLIAEQMGASTTARERSMRIALHALRLEFHHPQTARGMAATAPVPAHWITLPERIRAVAQHNAEESARRVGRGWEWICGL
ncbi:MAG: RNA pseudouridine synthase, partial [Planctomycetota bacterium]